MTRSSASFGLLFLKQMDITPHRLGNGTPVLIQETDETGIIKLSGTDLPTLIMLGIIFMTRSSPLMERTVVLRAIQPTTTPTGPLTTLKARIVTQISRGTCGSATERFMVQPRRLNVTKEV